MSAKESDSTVQFNVCAALRLDSGEARQINGRIVFCQRPAGHLGVHHWEDPDTAGQVEWSTDGRVRVMRLWDQAATAEDLPSALEAARDEWGPEGAQRPTWDEWGLALAQTVALRADCTRRQVGAVLMDAEHRIVATGYNGAPSGLPGCLSAGACPRGQQSVQEVAPGSSYDTGAGACIALHAEQNALLRASWDEMAEATLYVTHRPCDGCARMVQGTPVRVVVWPDGAWSPSDGPLA